MPNTESASKTFPAQGGRHRPSPEDLGDPSQSQTTMTQAQPPSPRDQVPGGWAGRHPSLSDVRPPRDTFLILGSEA